MHNFDDTPLKVRLNEAIRNDDFEPKTVLQHCCVKSHVYVKQNVQHLDHLQNQAMRITLAAHRKSCTQDMCTKLALLSLLAQSRHRFLRLQFFYKLVHDANCPHQLSTQLNNYLVRDHNYVNYRSFRDATLLDLGDTMSSAMGQSSFKFAAAQDLNDLAKELGSVSSFKTKVFKYFLKLDQKQHVCTAK